VLDFVMIGPRKTASTWLHDFYVNHPGVSLPVSSKETFYFDRFYSRGVQWHSRCFKKLSPSAIRGEFSPSYFTSREASERIRFECAGVKIIVCLRSPVDRLVSDYVHHLRYGVTRARLCQALHERNDLLESTKYELHVSRWKEAFGEHRVKVVYYEDLVSNPDAFVASISSCLGVDELPGSDSVRLARSNVGEMGVSPLMSGIASKLCWKLRSAGFGSLVSVAKTVGVKRLVYGGRAAEKNVLVSSDELAQVESNLEDETARYANRSY
jgi:hypothetical protein